MRLQSISAIKSKLGLDRNGRILQEATSICRKHMEKYVPKRTGQLRRNVEEVPGLITYKAVGKNGYHYSAKQYGTQFSHYTTPGTGPYWDKRMMSAEGTDVVKELQSYVGGGK